MQDLYTIEQCQEMFVEAAFDPNVLFTMAIFGILQLMFIGAFAALFYFFYGSIAYFSNQIYFYICNKIRKCKKN